MAVYTSVSDSELTTLLSGYNIGTDGTLKAIEQGIENSNYFLTIGPTKYILTIYEKRVNKDDLPFYLHLMEHLSAKGVPCPLPIRNKKGENLSKINDRPCAIISFLHGRTTPTIANPHLEGLGVAMAKMHLAARDFDMRQPNHFSLASWKTLFDASKPHADRLKTGLAAEIEERLAYITTHWPAYLPSGIIHADLFPDNVFFDHHKLVGIIDFYFACNDYWMYDLAICLNAWCFERNSEFNVTKAKRLLHAYDQVRTISKEELNALPILASGAALRFLLTRLYDWCHPVAGALVKPKNPLEYLEKLRFHSGIESHFEYGL